MARRFHLAARAGSRPLCPSFAIQPNLSSLAICSLFHPIHAASSGAPPLITTMESSPGASPRVSSLRFRQLTGEGGANSPLASVDNRPRTALFVGAVMKDCALLVLSQRCARALTNRNLLHPCPWEMECCSVCNVTPSIHFVHWPSLVPVL